MQRQRMGKLRAMAIAGMGGGVGGVEVGSVLVLLLALALVLVLVLELVLELELVLVWISCLSQWRVVVASWVLAGMDWPLMCSVIIEAVAMQMEQPRPRNLMFLIV